MRAFSRSFSWSLWPCLKACIFPKPWIFISLLEGRSVCPHYCKVVWLLTQTGIKLHSSGVTFFFSYFFYFLSDSRIKGRLGIYTNILSLSMFFFVCVLPSPLLSVPGPAAWQWGWASPILSLPTPGLLTVRCHLSGTFAHFIQAGDCGT